RPPHPADRTRPDDAARRADYDHDADAHPDGHTGGAPRPRREEDQRVVVAGLAVTRQARRDSEASRRAARQDETPRPDGEPGCRSPEAGSSNDVRSPAQVEGETGPGDVEHDRADTRHRDARAS